jgi:hypothetical protein
MHRHAGRLTVARIGLAAVLGLGGVLLNPAPARAADVFVQVNPSTVQAGFLAGIRASCTDNSRPATVQSGAFGTVTVQPQDGVLTAAALVPANTRADTYRVSLSCPDGKSASTNLIVVAAGRPTRGPATGFGGTAGDNPGGYLVAGGVAATAVGLLLGLVALGRRDGLVGTRPRRRRYGR